MVPFGVLHPHETGVQHRGDVNEACTPTEVGAKPCVDRRKPRSGLQPNLKKKRARIGNLGAKVEEATKLEACILRPLLGFDKSAITDMARALGTYELSIGNGKVEEERG